METLVLIFASSVLRVACHPRQFLFLYLSECQVGSIMSDLSYRCSRIQLFLRRWPLLLIGLLLRNFQVIAFILKLLHLFELFAPLLLD